MASKEHSQAKKKTSAKRTPANVDSLRLSKKTAAARRLVSPKKIQKKPLVEKIFIGKQVIDIKGVIRKGKTKAASAKNELSKAVMPAAPYRKPLAIGRYSHGYYLLLRQTTDDGVHTLLAITSADGTTFTNPAEKVSLHHAHGKEEDLSNCRDFRIFSDGDEMVLTYTRRDTADNHSVHHNPAHRDLPAQSSLVYAATKDHKVWIIGGEIKHTATRAKNLSNGVLVPELKDEAGDAVYFGGDMLRVALSKNAPKDPHGWNIVEPQRVPHWHFFDGAAFRIIGAVPIDKVTKQGTPIHTTLAHDAIALFYESEVAVDILADINLRNEKVGEERFIKMGVALFSQEMPSRLLWQTELPLIELPLDKAGNFSVIGVVHSDKTDHRLRIYGASQSGEVSFIEFSEKALADHRERRPVALAKHPKNPIIEPKSGISTDSSGRKHDHFWESEGSFNPAALEIDGKVHLLYRAVGSDGLSRIGYASSEDGVTIDERLPQPIFRLDMKPEDIARLTKDMNKRAMKKEDADQSQFGPMYSGGSWGGGAEDPKVTRIDDRVYLTYVAHHGWWPMRTALTSISVKDFLGKHWKWAKPVLMSPPNVGSKSVVILPEKVNGNYVIFHRLWPNIMVDVVPDLEFGDPWTDAGGRKRGGRWLSSTHRILPRKSFWDSQKLSMGSAPIRTSDGWLAVYNAVDRKDSSKYQIGAMLLDLQDPTKVIARSRKPILSPTEWYENDGKPGVAYPGGAVDLDGILHVYYGGGDKVGCVATIPTDNLVWHLLRDAEPKVEVKKVKM